MTSLFFRPYTSKALCRTPPRSAERAARIYTELEKSEKLTVSLDLSETRQLTMDEMNLFDGGYLFLKKLFHEAGIDAACDAAEKNRKFEFRLSEVLANLIYARILSLSSKLSSNEYMQSLIERPGFQLHDIYRALDAIDDESDTIQTLIYKKNRSSRNTSVLCYDCTNFFFETEEENGIRK